MRAVTSRAARSSHLATGLLRRIRRAPAAREGGLATRASSGAYPVGENAPNPSAPSEHAIAYLTRDRDNRGPPRRTPGRSQETREGHRRHSQEGWP